MIKVGDKFTVAVNMELFETPIMAAGFNIEYPADAMTLTSQKTNGYFDHENSKLENDLPGFLVVALTTTDPVIYDAEILTMEMEAIQAGSYEIKFTETVVKGKDNDPDSEWNNAGFSIIESEPAKISFTITITEGE